MYILRISDRESRKFNELRSLATNGSYNIKDEREKKSTSKYLGISNDFSREVKIQSGKFCDLCLLLIALNFLNFVFANLRKRIRFEAFQFNIHRYTI